MSDKKSESNSTRLSLLQSQLSSLRHSQKMSSKVEKIQDLLSPLYETETLDESSETSTKSRKTLKKFFQQKNKFLISTSEMVDILSNNHATTTLVNHIYSFMNEDIGINDSWLIYEISDIVTLLNSKKKSLFYMDIIKKCSSIKKTGLDIIKADSIEEFNENHEDWFNNIKHFFGGFISSSGDSFLKDETLIVFFESMVKYIMRDLTRKKIVRFNLINFVLRVIKFTLTLGMF